MGQISTRDRFRGCLLGLACGDAVGTTLEFEARGSFIPISDMVGGGPFSLEPGRWTDDTSMALCLAYSLLKRDRFDARDQMRRYLDWYRNGYLSSTGKCFDIGVRLAPIAMSCFNDVAARALRRRAGRATYGVGSDFAPDRVPGAFRVLSSVDGRTMSRTVVSNLGFSEPMAERPKFHANDISRDVLNVVPRAVPIDDARAREREPALDVEGFRLVTHVSAVRDFRDRAQIERVHVEEIRRLLLAVSGADHVAVTKAGVLRFAERSHESGVLNNSRPARFVHVDVSDATAKDFYSRSRPENGRRIRRAAQYNVWRVLTPPPQDVPLAVCEARSIAREDFIPADAVFDQDGQIDFSFEALLLRYNPNQRWAHFPDMNRDEALVFKTHDTDSTAAHCVPHGAFDNPDCGDDAPPRASIEMRGIAYWFE